MSSGRLKLINSCANRPELTIWQALPDSVSGNLQGHGIIANFTLVKRLCMLKKVVAIVREAGGIVSMPLESGEFRYDRSTAILASNALIADEIAAVFRRYTDGFHHGS